MNAIEIRNLTKRFGEKRAVDGLNMTVPEGAIYGFLGENGSGKSTTEKLVCGLLVPSGGSVELFGKKPRERERSIGVLIEAPGCYPSMSVWNNLLLHARTLGIRDEKREIARVLRLVHMEGSASNKFKNCSLGMRQRIGLAMALLSRPSLLVLDEPVNGLDADGRRIVREVITGAAKDGCTVLISSHLLPELEKIATHYGILRRGQMLREMTAEKLDADCPSFVSLKTGENGRAAELLQRAFGKAEEENGTIRVYGSVPAQKVSSLLFSEGIAIEEIGTAKIGLEEYYAKLMNGEERI